MIKDSTAALVLKISNRDDGTPLLHLIAQTKAARQMLERIESDLERARFLAVPCNKADIGSVCGINRGDNDQPKELVIPMALGCISLKMNESISCN